MRHGGWGPRRTPRPPTGSTPRRRGERCRVRIPEPGRCALNRPSTELILAAAGNAIGLPLSGAVKLASGSRATVLRCRTSTGDSVVVKAYRDDAEAVACFVAEAAGLAFTNQGPELLAVDHTVPLVVLSDLGTAPSLADALLGESAADAEAGLFAWAAGYGALAAGTVGRRDELTALRARYGGDRSTVEPSDWMAARLEALPSAVGRLGVVLTHDVDTDLAAVRVLADAQPFPVFSPGDICPDNNLLTPDGLRMLDFEGADYHSALLDAAYVRMPFATCWCVFRLPDHVSAAVEQEYRRHVVASYPELADDTEWNAGIRRAMAAWTIDVTVALGAMAVTGDRPMHPRRRPVPTVRQLLRHRWRSLADELEHAADLPALGDLARRLLAATRSWAAEPLPIYPAFRALR